jgi:hypothetical protein
MLPLRQCPDAERPIGGEGSRPWAAAWGFATIPMPPVRIQTGDDRGAAAALVQQQIRDECRLGAVL